MNISVQVLLKASRYSAIAAGLLFFAGCRANEQSISDYLQMVNNRPFLFGYQGRHVQGEIEIVLDPQQMAEIEKETGRTVGVIAKDNYWIWINDACIFPKGKRGVYGRILWTHAESDCPGVAVMPMTSDGKIILNCNFRHATRSWEIELPRGGLHPGEDSKAAAIRETMEETGMIIADLDLLGQMPSDSGMSPTVVPIYLAHVVGKSVPQQEDSEAIEEILTLTTEQIKVAFVKGYYELQVRGELKKVHFRDPFLAYAFLLYTLK